MPALHHSRLPFIAFHRRVDLFSVMIFQAQFLHDTRGVVVRGYLQAGHFQGLWMSCLHACALALHAFPNVNK